MNKQAGSLIELISDEQNYQCKNITATTYLQKETDNHEDKLSNEGNFQSEMWQEEIRHRHCKQRKQKLLPVHLESNNSDTHKKKILAWKTWAERHER